MSVFPRLNIWLKFVLSSIIILIPMTVLGYLLIQENVAQSKQQMLQESALASDLVALSVNDYLRSAQSLLRSAAQSPEVIRGDAPASEGVFGRIYLQQPNFRNIFVADLDAAADVSLFYPEEQGPLPETSRFFGQIARTHEEAISDRFFFQTEKLPVVLIGVPIRDASGEYNRVVSGLLSMSRLQLELGVLTANKEVSITIVDSRGSALVHPNWDYVYTGEDLSALQPVQAALSGGRGVMEYRAPDGEQWLAAYQPIQAAPWAVIVSEPVEVAYRPAQQALLRGLLYLGSALAIALLLGVVFGRILMEPLRQLVKRVRAMDIPEPKGSPPAEAGDELSQLNDAVGALWGRFQQNLDELDSTRQEIEAKQLELQSLLCRLSRAQEKERKRIAQDIHDGLSQFAYLALMNARRSAKLVATDSPEALKRLKMTEELLDQTVNEIRHTICNLEPPTRQQGGLIPALKRSAKIFEDSCGIPCELRVSGDRLKLRGEEETAVYRIVQEALNNTMQHSQAARLSINVECADGQVDVIVADDGIGFDPQLALQGNGLHFGLQGMQERAAAIGASLLISSSHQAGTEVLLSLRGKAARGRRQVSGPSETATGR